MKRVDKNISVCESAKDVSFYLWRTRSKAESHGFIFEKLEIRWWKEIIHLSEYKVHLVEKKMVKVKLKSIIVPYHKVGIKKN